MHIVRQCAGIAALVIFMMTGVAASTPGGTTISNAVTVSYNDGTHTYTTQSNTVASTVASVSALVVSPKNAAVNSATDAYALNAPVSRTFTITNTSNIADAYTLTSVTASAGSVASVTFAGPNGSTNAAGGAVSPAVPPGGTMTVVVTVATAGVPLNHPIAIGITARTTVTGTQTGLISDSGTQWAVAVGVPQLAGPGNATATILKTVDGLASESNVPGATVAYAIAFQNWGTVAATNGRLTDVVPPGVVPDPTSVKLNGAPVAATLQGQTLAVALGTIAPNVPMSVTFNATVSAAQTIGSTFVNVATLASDGIAAIGTTPASIFVGSANVVYDGTRGAQAPIGGALVSLIDPGTGQPLSLGNATTASAVRAPASASSVLAAVAPASVNPQNANPFRTGPNGIYGFTILAPAAGSSLSFDIMVNASGYLNRLIAAKITPDASGTLYTVVLTAKDGQPLASAGGYTLTTTSVMLSDVFSLLGNLPLFTPQSITVTKTADKAQAAPGDRIGYTVTFASSGQNALGTATIADTLPPGLAYAPGTARLDGTAIEPSPSGNQLVWTLPGLQPGVTHTIAYECVMLPTVSVGTTLTNTVGVSANVAGTQVKATGTGSVAVVAVDGAFSTQAVITGRVFIDDANTAHFRPGDRALEGVRIYLESGEAVTTDREGRFSFPGVRSGMHVLHLDETTLPPTARTYADRRYDSPRSPIRLIHGTMDLGLLQDVNFALEPVR